MVTKEEKLRDLYKQFLFARQMSEEELPEGFFFLLLQLFPALLVLRADGEVDSTEYLFLNKLSEMLEREFPEYPADKIKKELRNLVWNATIWREPFLRLLRFFVEEEEVRHRVLDFMIAAASSSSGDIIQNILHRALAKTSLTTPKIDEIQFVSEEEIKEMHNILEYIGAIHYHDVKEVMARLKS